MPDANIPAAPVSTGSLHDTDDIMVVLEARRLRRRWRLLGQFVKAGAFLAVIGAFGLLALAPVHPHFQCRSKQSEAKGNLKALYVDQVSFASERDDGSFGDQDAIGFVPKGARLRYRYAITDVRPATPDAPARFLAWAIASDADDALAGDVWRIDETGDLRHLAGTCRSDL